MNRDVRAATERGIGCSLAPAATPLVPISGMPPAAGAFPSGCTFHPRCGYAVASCTTDVPPLVREGERLLAMGRGAPRVTGHVRLSPLRLRRLLAAIR